MQTNSGRWAVVTAASRYLVDLDEHWLIRYPGEGSEADDGYYRVNSLRGDGEPLGLLTEPKWELELNIGQSTIFFLDNGQYRMTTPVQSFERVES